MNQFELPPFVESFQEAVLPYEGLRAWFMKGEKGQMAFHQADVETMVPDHTHCHQWGVVLAGRIDFVIGGRPLTCNRGDTYDLPDGVPHSARIYAGFRSMDYFEDSEHYRAKRDLGDRR